MFDTIKEGDEVKVRFGHTPYSEDSFWGKVCHIASATGDCWIIESGMEIHYVQTFAEIVKVKSEPSPT